MTQRKRTRGELKRLKRRSIEVDFEGGSLVTDGGVVLLREADRKLNLLQRVDEAIADPRDPRYVIHPQLQMLKSRVYGIASGYEDGNDHEQLRNDPAFLVGAEVSPEDGHAPLASPATLSRLENRATAKDAMRLHEVLVDTFLDSYDEPPDEITLDFDATDDPTHGDQEKKYFNGFYRGYCFLPLYVFCGDQILVSYLRPSSVGAAHRARPILKLLAKKIRSRWPNVRIIFRGDSGFCNDKLLRWCDKNNVFYVVGMQKNNTLEGRLKETSERCEAEFTKTQIKQRDFCWFRYGARRWKFKCWVVGKAEYTSKGGNPRFVVTNLPDYKSADELPEIDPGDFYDTRYCLRGEMENRIKEQMYLFSDRTSCTGFLANQMRLMFSSLAYALVDGIRRLALKGTSASRWRVDTIRLRLLKVAARVKVTARRVLFSFTSTYPYQSQFHKAIERLCDTS